MLLKNFSQYINQNNLLQKKDRILLAISGGIDSVVLCDVLHRAGFEIGLAHCNFSLRGIESDGDEEFVKHLAEKYKMPVFTTRFDTNAYATEHQLSIQMAARELRYEWLEQIRSQNDYVFIATAHHQNDLAETMLYNLTKGTGIAGLHGILPKNGKLIRPFLFASKQDIETYCAAQGLSYRTDASNDSTKYARNKIRHLVLPVLAELNPNVVQTFYDNAQRFIEVEQIYREGIAAYRKKLLERKKNDTLISIGKLQKIPSVRTVLYEILKEYGFNAAQTDQIAAAFEAEAGKIFYSETHQIIKDRKHFILSEKNDRNSGFALIEKGQTVVEKMDVSLQLEEISAENFVIPTDANIACLDFDRLQFPLMLRRWKDGDYFYPLGMKRKKKKLSRFFIDLKMPRIDKERVWVLADDKKHIVWVVGYRPDERFKITHKTEQVLKISIC
ncbi:MAG: tRNA lysidine(34) synthetase TilS [Chitinophagales bacterium]